MDVVVVVALVVVLLVVNLLGQGGVGYVGGSVGIIGVGEYRFPDPLDGYVGHRFGSISGFVRPLPLSI